MMEIIEELRKEKRTGETKKDEAQNKGRKEMRVEEKRGDGREKEARMATPGPSGSGRVMARAKAKGPAEYEERVEREITLGKWEYVGGATTTERRNGETERREEGRTLQIRGRENEKKYKRNGTPT